MKKAKIIIPVVLLVLLLGAAGAYLIYGSTLINAASEKSISQNLASDPDQPITVLATEKFGDYFGVLYSDPAEENTNLYRFRYVTKAPLYKNRYRNIGGYSGFTPAYLVCDEANLNDPARTQAEVFIYRVGKSEENSDRCSVFRANGSVGTINFDEITDPQQIVDKREEVAATIEKLDEFALPDEDTFIFSKTYPLTQPDDEIVVVEGSVSQQEMRRQVLDTTGQIIKEYNDYKEGEG